MERLAQWMVRHRLALFGVCLASLIVAWPIALRLEQDQSVQSLFEPNDPRLGLYNRAAVEFGGDATVLAVYQDADLLTAFGMRRLADYARRLGAVAGVTQAVSLADLPRPRDPVVWRDLAEHLVTDKSNEPDLLRRVTLALESWQPRRLADWFVDAPPPVVEELRGEILATDLFRDMFIDSATGTVAAVVLQLERKILEDGRIGAAIAALRAVPVEANTESRASSPSARLVGAPVMISDGYSYLRADAELLERVATLTMLAVIFLLFRNLRWVALPLLVCLVAIVWTRAVMVAADIRLSLIGAMTESLIIVIGIATVIHVTVLFGEEAEAAGDELDDERVMERTLVKILPAFGWTCATIAAGFASLLVSRIRPVQEYAVVMASAALFVGIASFLLIPAGGLLFRRWLPAAPRATLGESRLEAGLDWSVRFVVRHSFTTAGVLLAVLGVASLGFRSLEVETDFTKNFRADSPVIASYNFVEDRLGGAGLLEVVFDAPRPSADFLDRVRRCERELASLPGVTKVTGLPDVVDFAYDLVASQRLSNAGGLRPETGDRRSAGRPRSASSRQAPAPTLSTGIEWTEMLTRAVVERAALVALTRLPDGQGRRLLRQFWNPDAGRLRLLLRVRESQAVEAKTELLSRVEETVQRYLGESAKPTGLFVLLVFLMDTLVQDQWWSVGLSAGGIVVMASLAFGSVRLGLVAFAPKVVLVLAVIGAMGWLHLKMNVATAMIGSVSMGLVVAFSVPYLNRFRQERMAGVEFYAALARTHGSAGKAMVEANLALMIGFLVLVFSKFVPTVHFGFLVSVAILGGVIGNLVLLPVLLRLVYWAPPPGSN